MRFGLVGAGGIARSYVDVFATSSRADLVAVADVVAEAAGSLARAAGATPFESVEAMLDAVELDALVVSVPPDRHASVASVAIERGVAVLCEKPVSSDLASAVALVASAHRAHVPFAMATTYRCCADVVHARALVRDGAIGEVIQIDNAFTSALDMRGKWQANAAVSGGGVIMDNGTHSLDLVEFLAGPIDAVLTVEGRRPEGLDVEDSVHLHLRHGQVTGLVELSWSVQKSYEEIVRVHGTEGELSVGWRVSRWRRRGGEWNTFGEGYAKTPAMSAVVDAFADQVQGEDPWPLGDGLASAAAVDAAYRSLRSGTWASLGRP